VSLAERLEGVRARIRAAAAAVGRDPASVRLVAVSKTHPPEVIREAYALGQRDFGENYAQELAQKAEALRDLPDLRFRFIGGLQRNKAKLLVPTGCAIETVASLDAARAVHDRAFALGRRVEVMLQVNVVGEAQKGGVAVAEVAPLVSGVRALAALELTGLMVIPPFDDEQAARTCYREARSLAALHGLSQLSMGMSDDLELAIAEGSTSVRVGTAVFGPRSQPPAPIP
jgi:pyridoxal phosphate enzyme (YggS family)